MNGTRTGTKLIHVNEQIFGMTCYFYPHWSLRKIAIAKTDVFSFLYFIYVLNLQIFDVNNKWTSAQHVSA